MSTKHKTNSRPTIYHSWPSSSLGKKKQVRLTWIEWSWWRHILQSKHCCTNATGTTTGTINTAVVPLTVTLSWHSSPVWWYWKRAIVFIHSVVKDVQSRSTSKSSEDFTGSSTGQGFILCFKVACRWSCCKLLLIRQFLCCIERKMAWQYLFPDILFVYCILFVFHLKFGKFTACIHLPVESIGYKVVY